MNRSKHLLKATGLLELLKSSVRVSIEDRSENIDMWSTLVGNNVHIVIKVGSIYTYANTSYTELATHIRALPGYGARTALEKLMAEFGITSRSRTIEIGSDEFREYTF